MATSRAAIGLMLLAGTVTGQEKGETDRPPNVPIPVRVQLVIHKQLGDKKLSSLAYAFPCSPHDRKTTLKFGVEVPVPVRKAESVEFQYRNVGANIECEANRVPEGRFHLRIAFEQSSVHGAGEKATSEQSLESRAANPLLFRTATSHFTAVLRDGQTTQAVTGTDPLTGEVTAVDVTLTVQK
jgi:hypothetical protein